VSAAGSGLNDRQVAIFMSFSVLAGALTQWPVGRISDRVDRRMVLFALLIGSAITGVALWLFADNSPLLLGLGFLFGALALPGYSLAAAHAYDKTARSDMVATAATVLLVNAAGSVIGPLLASLLMTHDMPRRLFLFTALVQGALAAYILYRTQVQPPTRVVEKTEFDLAATAQVGVVHVPAPEGTPPEDSIAPLQPTPNTAEPAATSQAE
jgi:MFS family permease